MSRENNLSDEQEGENRAEPNANEVVDTLSATLKLKDDTISALKTAKTEHNTIIKFTKSANRYIQLTTTGIIKTAPEDTGVEGPIEVKVEWEIKHSEVEIKEGSIPEF